MYKYAKVYAFIVAALFLTISSLSYAQTSPNVIVEDAVRFYFADVPVMIDIARCETGFRQYNSDGSALHDASGTYIGVFQISEQIHKPRAQSMGLDLSTIDGNLGYARYLYNTSGTGPWKGCLPKSVNSNPLPPPTGLSATPGGITSILRMGMSSAQVLTMQQILNQKGFVIAATGPGSVGHETNYFGSLTREALKRFQCAKGIVCTGNEATTGYGRVGPKTMQVLNQ